MKHVSADYVNMGLMVIASIAAIYLPFDLLLLSYVILGPAHYLTEISWLHDRKYFSLNQQEVLVIVGFAVIAIVSLFLSLTTMYPILVCICLSLPFIFQFFKGLWPRAICIVILIAAASLFSFFNGFVLLFGLYVPTLIHVYIFTGTFMLLGAIKKKQVSGYITISFFIACPLLLSFCFPGIALAISPWAKKNYVLAFSSLNANLVKGLAEKNVFVDSYSIAATRCIAFAYTYHYLNWFSKVNIIKWHNMSKKRLTILLVIWLISVGLYCYDFKVGFQVLFTLSFLHVVLEFPLNHKTLQGIRNALIK